MFIEKLRWGHLNTRFSIEVSVYIYFPTDPNFQSCSLPQFENSDSLDLFQRKTG